MSDPAPPPRPFPGAAASALAPVAGKVEEAKLRAQTGTLQIDLDAAKALIKQIGALKARAGELVKDCADLDTPLKFGDNWVGQIMSERLRTVAVDKDGGVTPVLSTFHKVLDDLEATVRFAAGLYQTTDQQVVDDLQRASTRILGEVTS